MPNKHLETTCGRYENTSGTWIEKSSGRIVADTIIDALIDSNELE